MLAHRDAECFVLLDLLRSAKLFWAHGALPYRAPSGMSSHDREPQKNFPPAESALKICSSCLRKVAAQSLQISRFADAPGIAVVRVISWGG